MLFCVSSQTPCKIGEFSARHLAGRHGELAVPDRDVDAAVRRWQRYTGEAAAHAVTGQRFDDVQAVTKEATHVPA